MKTLSLIYLIHFIYIPIIIVYAILLGEDLTSIGLYITLTFIVCLVLYGFNLITTQIGLKYLSNKFIPFLLPALILMVSYIPLSRLLQEFDFGGEFGGVQIIVGTFVLNTISYFYYLKK